MEFYQTKVKIDRRPKEGVESVVSSHTMKSWLTLVLIAVFAIGSTSWMPHEEGQEIEWMDFNEGFAKANAEGKIAIIDCYTDWCGWCKVMDKKTFSDGEVIKKMNDNFIAIKFNPEIKDREYIVGADTMSGPQLLYALSNNKPGGYPTLFYYIPQTNRMFQQPGYQDVKQFHQSMDNLIEYQNKITLGN